MRRLARHIGCIALLTMAPISVYAEAIPLPGTTDRRVREVRFDPDQVYRLRGFVGRQIHLQLEEGESYEGLAGGDLPGLTVDATGRHVFLKPAVPHLETNLTLVTSRRSYEIDYSVSVFKAARDDGDLIYLLKFAYPDVPRAAATAHQLDDALAAAASQVRNENYWYCGADALRPTAAWDDGAHTWIEFAQHTEWPAVFVRADDGTEGLVNFSVHDNRLVVHRVAKRLVLRRGKLTGCVINRSFNGGSEARPAGTISSDIDRKLIGARP